MSGHGAATDIPFWKKQMRIAAIQYGQKPEDTMKVPQILEQAGFNTEQLLHTVAREGYGLYNKQKHNKILWEYLADSKRRGISVILYANAHMIEQPTFEQHPNWVQRAEDGSPVVAYGNYTLVCVNSPWRDSFLSDIKDMLEQDIQGIFLDGPLFNGGGCYCEECQKRFMAEFGHPIADATRKEMREFKTEHVVRLVRDVRDVISKSGKNVILYVNSIGLGENITGCDLDGIFPYVDFVGSEGGFLFYEDPNRVSLWKTPECTKYLESKSYGKPYVVFNAANHQPWARHMLTREETLLSFASVVANGGNVWYGIHGPIDNYDTPAGREAFRFNRFIQKNEAYFEQTQQCADVALLWSRCTVNSFPDLVDETDFTRKEKGKTETGLGSFQREFNGIADMLFRCHRQFAIIDETNILHDDLLQFKTLIMPNAMCLDDHTALKIRDYVKGGGNLIGTLASGRYDEDGNSRGKSLLDDVCGILSEDGGVINYDYGCGYMTAEEDGVSGEQKSGTVAAGFTTPVLKCRFDANAQVLISCFMPMEGRYSKFNDEKYPGVVVSSYGKGRAAYVAGGIGQTYAEFGILDMLYILDGLVERFTPGELRVKNAFPSVEVEMRTQPATGCKLIHFVNHTGCMRRPIEKIIPCRGIEVSLKSEKMVTKVHSLYHPADIPFIQTGDTVHFTADVEEYELVAIEY